MRYVLDTNIAARLLNHDARVVDRLVDCTGDDIGLPTVVLAELLFGAEKSARRASNLARVEGLANGVRVLAFDEQVARRYASVRASLERKGAPKSDFDLVIACTALEHRATLVTHDSALKDGTIGDLLVEDWVQ